jgi:hypothetical protein
MQPITNRDSSVRARTATERAVVSWLQSLDEAVFAHEPIATTTRTSDLDGDDNAFDAARAAVHVLSGMALSRRLREVLIDSLLEASR